jgi:hypothetical protein
MEQPPPRGRGRPKKENALSAAERARRYREGKKSAGLIKRYVTENDEQKGNTENAEFWIGNSSRLGDLLKEMTAKHDFLAAEVVRLHAENEELLARAKSAEAFLTATQKELIVTRHKLAELTTKLP